MKHILISILCALALCAAPAFAAPATVSVGTASTEIVPADSQREWVIIGNPSTNSAAVYIGVNGTPTTSNGEELLPGASLVLSGPAARQVINGIVASGTVTVRVQKP